MPWSRIKRTLDSFETRFVRGGLRMQQARVEALRSVVEEALRTGTPLAQVNLEGDFQALVESFVKHVLVEGIVQGDADVRAEERRARAAGVNLAVDGQPVVPTEAIAFIESRRDLNRFFDREQAEKVRSVVAESLREGRTVKQTMAELQKALPGASRARLENIARTEATAAYNQGRVYRFLQSKGFIQAVRFDAILDSRVTDICEHRNGLLFALDDPRLRLNVPPLHYQCRSVLSPVSGYKLEKLGGKARLDADREKMDVAPGPQVTKRGAFGNEPWPDVQGGGAAPRAKPVGPKAGPGRVEPGPRAEAEPVRTPSGPKGPAGGGGDVHPEPVPTRTPVTVDPLPSASKGPSGHRPPVPDGPIMVPPGLVPAFHAEISPEHPVVREILWSVFGLPPEVLRVMQDGGVRLEFDDRNPFWRTPLRNLEDLFRTIEALRLNPPAVTVTGAPGRSDVTMFFRPGMLVSSGHSPRWAAFHESGHAVSRLLKLVDDPDVLAAFEAERMGLLETFWESPSEFLAEGFAYRHYSARTRMYVQRKAPRLYGIVDGRMISLSANAVQVLYDGPEGIALYEEGADTLFFALNIGKGAKGGDVSRFGTVVSYGGSHSSVGNVHVSWSDEKQWTPEEAEPYKAFLRSKGVTLPHVMS